MRARLKSGVGPVGKGTGCRAELRYYEHLAERGPYWLPPFHVSVCSTEHKAQGLRVGGKEGCLVSWTNSTFGSNQGPNLALTPTPFA